VEYQVKQGGGVDFTFLDAGGSVREESHERRAGGGGKGGGGKGGGGKGGGDRRPPVTDERRPGPPAREGGGGGDRGGGRPRPDPLAEALDANRDGVIDAQEMADAESLLRKLDTDGDGKLSREEATGRKGGDAGGGRPR
jgi:hypothetical protein